MTPLPKLADILRTCAKESEQGRNFAGVPYHCREAADRLTALAAENERLRKGFLHIVKSWPDSSDARHARATLAEASPCAS